MEAVTLRVDGNRQNITIPESMNFKDDDLCAAKIGDAVIIMPQRSVRQLMRLGFDSFSPDIFSEGRAPLKSATAAQV